MQICMHALHSGIVARCWSGPWRGARLYTGAGTGGGGGWPNRVFLEQRTCGITNNAVCLHAHRLGGDRGADGKHGGQEAGWAPNIPHVSARLGVRWAGTLHRRRHQVSPPLSTLRDHRVATSQSFSVYPRSPNISPGFPTCPTGSFLLEVARWLCCVPGLGLVMMTGLPLSQWSLRR